MIIHDFCCDFQIVGSEFGTNIHSAFSKRFRCNAVNVTAYPITAADHVLYEQCIRLAVSPPSRMACRVAQLKARTEQWVHCAQTTPQSPDLSPQGTFRMWCNRSKSAVTAWSYPVNRDQNLRGTFPGIIWICATKNEDSSKGKGRPTRCFNLNLAECI